MSETTLKKAASRRVKVGESAKKAAAPATARRPRSRKPTNGHFVLVIGPSGAGKDTLIAAAQRKFRLDPRLVFPRRVITRPEGMGEEHLPVSRREFERLRRAGAFVLSWTAHGLSYGVPVEAAAAARAGHIVVVNVSRAIVDEACATWPGSHVVEVTVALEALKARLEARGRETRDEIARRLQRAIAPRPAAAARVWIDNSGSLAASVRRFNALLAAYAEAVGTR